LKFYLRMSTADANVKASWVAVVTYRLYHDPPPTYPGYIAHILFRAHPSPLYIVLLNLFLMQ
jgi:hypothetical protein